MVKPDIYYRNAAKQWIIRAKDDILWTENNIRGGFYTQACFTAQFESHCRILNEYYAPTRYPEILGLEFRGYGKKQAEEALSLSKEILEFVGEKIRNLDK